MISQRLVLLIETHADELAKRWVRDVRQNPATKGYRAFPEATLHQRAFDVYAHLGRWVGSDGQGEQVEQTYARLGAERFREGVLLSEVLEALALTRRHLWRFVLEQGLLDTAIHLHQGLELYNRVVLFFDHAVYHTAVGYEQAAGLGRGTAG